LLQNGYPQGVITYNINGVLNRNKNDPVVTVPKNAGKTKRRLHDMKTEHFKALSKSDHTSAIADHMRTTGYNTKWDHFADSRTSTIFKC